MKRRLLCTLALIAGTFCAHAQITINEGTHPLTVNGTDSLQGANVTSITWPDSGTNKTWDYGSLMDTANLSVYSYAAPSSSNFSAASRYLSSTSYLNSIPIVKLEYSENSSSAYTIMGSEFAVRQAFNISAVTGGSNDSLIFPVQHQVYASAEKILPYPLAYHSSWSSKTRVVDHFLLTVAAYSMNNTPGEHVSNVIYNAKVVGWGKLRVPFHKGGTTVASAYYDVLMVERTEWAIDSFYLNGSPAPSALLSYFGLKNADTFMYHNLIFYRPYTGLPIAQFNVAPNGNRYAFYDRANTALLGIENAGQAAESVSIYPNPVNAATATLSFNKVSAGAVKLTIINAMGQVMHEQNINQPVGMVQMQVDLPAALSNGMYFYSLSSRDGAAVNGKILLNR